MNSKSNIFSTENCDKIFERLAERSALHSLLLYKEESLLFERYDPAFDGNTLHRLFSVSKTLTAIAIGKLIDQGLISISDRICTYFPEKFPVPGDENSVHPWIREITIENCLMMKTAHASTTYRIGGRADFVGSFFTKEPTHRAGRIFHYDTSASHVLGALVEKLSHKTLIDFLRTEIPELGLSENAYFLLDPQGVSIGGTGLCGSSYDLLAIGKFILNTLKQDTPFAAYLRRAVSCLSSTRTTANIPGESYGYGYYVWTLPNETFMCYGMGGQFIFVCPRHDFLMITTANTQGRAGANQFFHDEFNALVCSLDNEAGLTKNSVPSHTFFKGYELGAPISDSISEIKETHPDFVFKNNFENIIGKTYTFKPNPNGFENFTLNEESVVLTLAQADKDAPDGTGEGTVVIPLPRRNALAAANSGKNSACDTSTPASPSQNSTDIASPLATPGQDFPDASFIFPGIEQKAYSHIQLLPDETVLVTISLLDSYMGDFLVQLSFADDDLVVHMIKREESMLPNFNGHIYGKISR